MKLDNIIAKRENKTIYRDNDKVIKVFDEGYSKADVLNEALNQAKVEAIDLNIPKILEVTKIDNKWAIVSEYIEGKTLNQLISENPEKRLEYMEFFVDLQIKMHAQKCPILNRLRDKVHQKISQTEFDATTRYDLHTRLEGMPKHNKVCHGDFNPSNIIITPDNKAYIIDWAHVTQGNASADVARTYLLFKLKGFDEDAEIYLNMFCKKTDTARQYVQQWLPIVAASQSVKGKKEEKEFLACWVNVVDYE